MEKYGIRDIVKFKKDIDDDIYYIITDYDGELHGEYFYKIAQIYPVKLESKNIIIRESLLSIFMRADDKDYEFLMREIKRDREKNGFYAIPSYEKEISKSLRLLLHSARKKNKIVIKPSEDVVYYQNIDNIDECLDALNDLKILYKLFGDEAYLQLREMVEKRLIHILK